MLNRFWAASLASAEETGGFGDRGIGRSGHQSPGDRPVRGDAVKPSRRRARLAPVFTRRAGSGLARQPGPCRFPGFAAAGPVPCTVLLLTT